MTKRPTSGTPMGSAGHWPVPSGDSPLGIGNARELFHASIGNADFLPVPSGQWPDGTGGSPVPPALVLEFGLTRIFHQSDDSGFAVTRTGKRIPVTASGATFSRRGHTPPYPRCLSACRGQHSVQLSRCPTPPPPVGRSPDTDSCWRAAAARGACCATPPPQSSRA